jgi:hypothetical protein
MPTVTIAEPVTLQDAAKALQDKLGEGYEVTTHGSGSQEELKVKKSVATTATVHQSREGNATTFHVQGGGLVITRLVNEFGIAKKVAATIKEAFGEAQPDDAAQS